ncbi:MAG: hypothetical protein NVSMB32_13240 [Actinomycetota bacterium]
MRGTDGARPMWHWGLAAYAMALAVAAATSALSLRFLPFIGLRPDGPITLPVPWLEGWFRWDGAWYAHIARFGYYYGGPHVQSPVAFFPGYPLAMRWLGVVVGGVEVAGILITVLAGALAALAFYAWSARLTNVRTARMGLAILLTYPFAFYLVGAVYSDALFLAAAVGAFLLLERGSPVLAGLVGAVATATRPVGLALVVGLALRAYELRRRAGGERTDAQHRGWWTLLSGTGLAAYCAVLWYRFGSPLAFMAVSDAPGWGHDLRWRTIFKTNSLPYLRHPANLIHTAVLLQAAVTLLALCLLPLVVRRFGVAYGIYSGLVLVVPALVSPEFIGLGRYGLAAFPCFAAAGDLLARRSRLALGWLGMSAAGFVTLTSLFARGAYFS